MLESIFVCSFCGRVVVHPDFTVVAPVHRIGFPELREQEKSALEAYVHSVCASWSHFSLHYLRHYCSVNGQTGELLHDNANAINEFGQI